MSDQAPDKERLAAWERSRNQRQNRSQYVNPYNAIEEEDAGTYTVEHGEDKDGNRLIRVIPARDGANHQQAPGECTGGRPRL